MLTYSFLIHFTSKLRHVYAPQHPAGHLFLLTSAKKKKQRTDHTITSAKKKKKKPNSPNNKKPKSAESRWSCGVVTMAGSGGNKAAKHSANGNTSAAVKIVTNARKAWCTDKSGVTFREQNNLPAPVGELVLLPPLTVTLLHHHRGYFSLDNTAGINEWKSVHYQL